MRGAVAIGVAVALSASTASRLVRGRSGRILPGNLSVSTSSLSRSPARGRHVRSGDVERLRDSLSERDWAVIRDVARLRLVTGTQLERLHFTDLSETSGPVVRRRVLGRLVQAGARDTGAADRRGTGRIGRARVLPRRRWTTALVVRRPGSTGGASR